MDTTTATGTESVATTTTGLESGSNYIGVHKYPGGNGVLGGKRSDAVMSGVGDRREGGMGAVGSGVGNWQGINSNLGARSVSVYSAPAAVNSSSMLARSATGGTRSQNTTGGCNEDDEDDGRSTTATTNGYNPTADLPSYTRPSYTRSESNGNYLAVGVLLISLTLRKS